MNRCISRWGPSVRWRNKLAMRWRMGVRNSAHTTKLATPFGEGEALRLSSVSHPEYVPRVANFFRETGGRALLMHGTEGEVYANPQRCPQISLIDEQGVRVLYERQTEMAAEAVVLPTSKDPEVTARWIERCVAGVEPVPNSLKTQLACCLLACGKSPRWSRASAASTTVGDRICRIKARPVARTGKARVLKVFSGLIQWLTDGCSDYL